MRFFPLKGVAIDIPKAILTAIFDECDRFDDDETGGRILGTYSAEARSLQLDVKALIDSGPQATRSAVSFFQDGAYQEKIFREIETKYPDIEHLGNWHTHHMNGLQHLSSGDLQTYHRIVNHPKHNTDFFYALLITTKHQTRDPLARYSVKHYLFRRGDPKAYEIPARSVRFTDDKHITIHPRTPTTPTATPLEVPVPSHSPTPTIVADKQIIEEFFPDVHPFQSPKLGMFWKGPLGLANGRKVEVVALPDTDKKGHFSALLRDAPEVLVPVNREFQEMAFPSARAALLAMERICNQRLFTAKHKEPATS